MCLHSPHGKQFDKFSGKSCVVHMPVQQLGHAHVCKQAENVSQVCIGLNLSGASRVWHAVFCVCQAHHPLESAHMNVIGIGTFLALNHRWKKSLVTLILFVPKTNSVLHTACRCSLVDSSSCGVDDQRAARAVEVWQIQAHD